MPIKRTIPCDGLNIGSSTSKLDEPFLRRSRPIMVIEWPRSLLVKRQNGREFLRHLPGC